MPTHYAETLAQCVKVRNRPRVSATFALDRTLWHDRKVAVRCITVGNAHRRTTARFYYGTLDLTAGSPDQIGVVHTDGSTSLLHRTKAVDVYDLTRTKA